MLALLAMTATIAPPLREAAYNRRHAPAVGVVEETVMSEERYVLFTQPG
jgi:hypothetical protein